MKPARHLLPALVLALPLAFAAAPAAALRFGEAWDAARANDAQFRSAGFERDAARESVPIARAGLLPNVNLNVTRSRVNGTREFPNALNQPVEVQVGYEAPSTTLSMRTPLFNYEAVTRLAQAQVQSDGAEALFRLRAFDLVDRLGTAYVTLLLADETLTLAEAQVQTLQGQLARAEGRFARGEGTRIEVAQAQAGLDVARVRVIEARDQREVARRDLRRIVGSEPAKLQRVSPDFVPTPLAPAGLEDWLELARAQNAAIQVRQRAAEGARLAVQRNRAGHMPRLDLVASLSDTRNESLSTLNQKSSLTTVGLQLVVPIFAGGGVEASVRQAISEQMRVDEDLQVQREQVEFDVQRYHTVVTNGAAKVEAFRRAVASGEVALQGATRAFETGVGTATAVLEAQAQLYSSRRDLAQARYDYLVARLRLMAQAGVPPEDIVADVDRHLSQAPTEGQGPTR